MNKDIKKTVRNRMENKIPVFDVKDKVGKVIDTINKRISHYEMIDYIYVVSKGNILKGVISFRELLKADIGKDLSKIMNKKVITIHPSQDQEDAVVKALDHNLKAVPVVDKNNKLLGVIPPHTLFGILHEESTEDLLKIAGVRRYRETKKTVFGMASARVPWIIFGLVGGIIAATIIGIFNNIVESVILLAMYIPVMMNISGSVGNHASIIYIRNEALNRVENRLKYFIKEIEVGLIIAFICAIGIMAFTSFWHSSPQTGFIIGSALFLAAMFGMTIGVCAPIFLEKLGKDPANGSGPVVTAILDVISLTVYLITATVLLSLI